LDKNYHYAVKDGATVLVSNVAKISSVPSPNGFTVALASDDALRAAVELEADAVHSRHLFSGSAVSIATVAIGAGAVMSEHMALAPILIQVVHGHVTMTLDGADTDLPEGAIVHVEAEVRHSVLAHEPSWLLVMVLGPHRTIHEQEDGAQ
jgi:quercetin dioxygenase-like cupin family protein